MQTLAGWINRRVETGALKVGADWPGVFLRGDEALGLANDIENAQRSEMLPAAGPGAGLLKRVVDLLRSCQVNERG